MAPLTSVNQNAQTSLTMLCKLVSFMCSEGATLCWQANTYCLYISKKIKTNISYEVKTNDKIPAIVWCT